jgi:formylmethanofuran dehydrogenase subunit B
MNRYTRFVALAHRGGGNRAGADNVLAWRTGYPFAVNFGRGYPRYGPGEFTAEALLARREVDAALVIGADPLTEFGSEARDHLATITSIVVDPRDTATSRQATVAFAVAKCGVHTGGTVYRFDDVPIPLRPAFPSTRPSDYDVLSGIERRVRERVGEQAPAAAAR